MKITKKKPRNFIQNMKGLLKIAKFLYAGYQANVFIFIKDCFVNFYKYRIIGNNIRIDASSICQLQCPLCWQSQEGNESLKRRYLKYDDFKKFIDTHPTFKNIELSDNGEIFLNPELKDIIRYAHEKRINLTAKNGVNLNTASEEILECLAKYQFRMMVVSIDGATSDTYRIYRKRGHFDNVIENINRINFFKKKYHTKFPKLIWQFVVFGHNMSELPLAREKAKKLNMRFLPILNYYDPSYSPVKIEKFPGIENEYFSLEDYERKMECLYTFPCSQLWFGPQISPDGELLGCCAHNSRPESFGNVFASGLKGPLGNEKFIYAKKMLLGKIKPREDILCFHCKMFSKIRSRKTSLAVSFLGSLTRYL